MKRRRAEKRWARASMALRDARHQAAGTSRQVRRADAKAAMHRADRAIGRAEIAEALDALAGEVGDPAGSPLSAYWRAVGVLCEALGSVDPLMAHDIVEADIRDTQALCTVVVARGDLPAVVRQSARAVLDAALRAAAMLDPELLV